MAKTEVQSIVNALKQEVKNQETLKMINGALADIPVRETRASNAYPITRYNKKFHQELLRAIEILEGGAQADETRRIKAVKKALFYINKLVANLLRVYDKGAFLEVGILADKGCMNEEESEDCLREIFNKAYSESTHNTSSPYYEEYLAIHSIADLVLNY
ncbi:hypothetical protein [Aureispira sp. CCB-QB1]|uniref:hypothetical protein n=1 Tax=Aureispira sp. CCB-QB1 TaxID=1313421 RepID=UPI000698943B|nr:hypothetical protein [Aureispira sp. CCB-QB1]